MSEMEGKPVDGEPPIDLDVMARIEKLELEKQKMHSEFNVQRAKMKELFLQKESDCKNLTAELNEIKSQLLVAEYKTKSDMQYQEQKAQEEIASLQQLVQETIDESSLYKHELEKLKHENRELRDTIVSHQQQEQQTPSLAPVISHVKKTLARKLGTDSGGNFDSLDDSMRKAQEDAEVLRSLVVPLEEEIKALKEKLRAADDDLQSYRLNSNDESMGAVKPNSEMKFPSSPLQKHDPKNIDSVSKSTSMDYLQCEMCKNYEMKLVQTQKLHTESKNKLEQMQKNLNDAREELNKEAALRQDLEEQWQLKREEHKSEVQTLSEQVKKSEKELINLQQQFLDTKDEINQRLFQLTADRENVDRHLKTLQNHNEFLAGRHIASSEELQNQRIDFPNNVEELHELLLKQRDELIKARAGQELEERKCLSYIDEAQLLREKLESVTKEKHASEKKVQAHIKSLEERLQSVLVSQQDKNAVCENYKKKEAELNKQLTDLHVELNELKSGKQKLEKTNSDYKTKIKILQEELSTSEHVQKDFVKLSQSLQMALEKIRQADTEVRWQDDEDVDKCPSCNALFTVTIRKQHCRHCGSIYCEKCLTKTVPSGPRKKPARVCDICHTLLIPDTAPYFSQAPPQTPT